MQGIRGESGEAGGEGLGSMDLGLVEATVQGVFDWWDTVDQSEAWQSHIFYSLAGAYGVIALIALVCIASPPFRSVSEQCSGCML